ncbi:MAG TPA: roadblock/LC7 domain-containing protein [Myxococcota bacterium]|nr:roadblock/LC7 domain-containing protein [Myxococcota bacterium]
MHWLSERLRDLHARHQRYSTLRQDRIARGIDVADPEEVQLRGTFFSALRGLLREVATRPGVTACFAEHDGLLVDCVGDPEDADGLAAMAQTVIVPARRASQATRLGGLDQMVMVGASHKLALILVGEVSLGILAPTHVHLARVLQS